MRIQCPCDELVTPRMVNGIIMYMHQDGTGCKSLNRFYMDKCASFAWSKCKEAIETQDVETFNVYMCVDTKLVRTHLLDYVSFLNKQELADALVFMLANNAIRRDIMSCIVEDLIDTFGMIAYDNIVAIADPLPKSDMLRTRARNVKEPKRMVNVSSDVKIARHTSKENIVSDLARSFLIDKAIRSSNFENVLKNLAK